MTMSYPSVVWRKTVIRAKPIPFALLLLLIFISQTVPRSSLDRLSPSPFSPFHFEFFTSTLKDIKIKVSVGRNGAAQLKRDQVGFFVLFCLNNKMKNFSASQVCRWTHSLKLDEVDEEASSSIIIQNRRKDKQVFGWTGLLLLTERRGQARGSAQ